jgi:nucleoside-diphosphate-sugar epimerase
LVRICADTVIVNVCLFAGLLANHLVTELTKHPSAIVEPYLRSFSLLTVTCLVTFYAMGFYTRGRAYQSRFKVLIVTQATILAFLIFGFAQYAVPYFGRIGRPALFFSWSFSCVVLSVARVWSAIWRRLAAVEGTLGTSALSKSECLADGPGKVLVIGGAGYIGSALIGKLLQDGHEVRLLDAFLYGHDAISAYERHPNLEIVEGDFRRVDLVVKAVQGVDMVIHLGAIVGDPACALDEEVTIETNLLATRMIAEVTKGEGIRRFVFASTCSVYGASDQYLDERSSLNPVSLYARSKIACENVLRSMKSDTFVPVILRFGTIYGLSGRTRFDLVVNLLAAKAAVDGVITVYGSDQWRPFLHVDDAAQAVYLACSAREVLLAETVFNVGSDSQNYTLGDVGRLIKSKVPTADLQFFEQNVDRRNYRVNFSRIEKSLGFAPKWTLDSGIQQVLDAIASGKVVDYREPRYSNVKYLTEEVKMQDLRYSEHVWARNAIFSDDLVTVGE